MVEKDDWRLLNHVEYLKKAHINPTDGEEICKHAPHLKRCAFCLEPVQDNSHQWWFVPTDLSGCICEECYNNFKEDFEWKKLDGWDIKWFVRCPKCGEVLSRTSSYEEYVYECLKCHTLYSWDLSDNLELN